ncbi:Cation efflux protein [mine drainage metagenome]|uniref:Cation efflux protein n=1 Tax=mine drainage metagenome TaxID=410659 RepID=T1BW64_9ZZZZ
MSHAEPHGSDHSVAALPAASKRLFVSLGLTLVFGVVECAMAEWSHSLALLGDAGHMFTDSLGLVIATVGAWLARRPPRSIRPTGGGARR